MMSKANRRTLLAIFILFTFHSAPVFATYDERCLELLTTKRTPAQESAFSDVRDDDRHEFFIGHNLLRPVADIEHEAYMDFSRGLPLIGIFADGERSSFTNDTESLDKFNEHLEKSSLVEVVYLPDSLKKLGDLYKQGCQLLQKSGCEIYDNYPGLSSQLPRPFSPFQEQALKWCTFYQASLPGRAKTMVHLRDSGRKSDVQITEVHWISEKYKSRDANEILVTAFSRAEAVILFKELVQPFISASFARTYELYKGRKPN